MSYSPEEFEEKQAAWGCCACSYTQTGDKEHFHPKPDSKKNVCQPPQLYCDACHHCKEAHVQYPQSALVVGVNYQDRATGCVWALVPVDKAKKGVDDDKPTSEAAHVKLVCAVCRGSLWNCAGCGQYSTKYPHLFGCCSTQVLCPQCFSLQGPAKEGIDWLGGVHSTFSYKQRYERIATVDEVEAGPKAIKGTHAPNIVRFSVLAANMQDIRPYGGDDEMEEEEDDSPKELKTSSASSAAASSAPASSASS